MQAHYENLPVFKAALDLAVYFEKTVHHFARYHKYTIGTDLKNLSRSILILIARASKNWLRAKRSSLILSRQTKAPRPRM